MRLVVLLCVCTLLRASECVPVHGDQITAGDMAVVDSAFRGTSADTPIVAAPRAGVTRYLTAADLRRIAARHGLESGAEASACFAWPMRDIDPHQLHRTLTDALGTATVEVLNVSKTQIPLGRFVFDRRGLSVVDRTAAIFIWRGTVQYADRLSFPVWARVRLAATSPCAVAADKLSTGTVITTDLVRTSEEPVPATVAVDCLAVTNAVRKRTRRLVRAGEVLRPIDLEAVPAIHRGDEVSVDVYRGRTHLSFIAKAEGPGAEGGRIMLRNPRSGKRFEARVAGPGRAEVGSRGADE